MEQKRKKVVESVSPEELVASYQVAAPGANKFVITVGQPGVRIAFGEVHPDLKVPQFHSAVTLHPLDAIQLYKIMEEMLRDIEKQIVPLGSSQEGLQGAGDGDG